MMFLSMKKKRWLLGGTIVALSVAFISSCSSSTESVSSVDSSSTSSSSSELTVVPYSELEAIEKNLLDRQYIGFDLVSTIRAGSVVNENNLTFQVFYDSHNFQVISYVDNKEFNNRDYIFYQINGWEYTYLKTGDMIKTSNQLAVFDSDSLFNSSLVDDLDEVLSQVNVSISKKSKGELTDYYIELKNFDSFFHQITNNEYKDLGDENSLSLPETININVGVKNNLLAYEECDFSFLLNDKKGRVAIRVDYEYEKKPFLPGIIKEAVLKNFQRDTSKDYPEYINSVLLSPDGFTLPLKEDYPFNENESYHEPETLNQARPTRVINDRKKYIVTYNDFGNFVQIYNAFTLERIYDVVFSDTFYSINCVDGKLVIKFDCFNGRNNPYYYYSLNDMSLLYITEYSGLFYDDKLYYSIHEEEEYRVKVINLKTRKSLTLYSFSEHDLPPETYGVDYNLYLEEEKGILFFWDIVNSNDLHYCGFDLSTNEKLYEKTLEGQGVYKRDTKWEDGFLILVEKNKAINSLTGEISEYLKQQHQYRIPNDYHDYEIRGAQTLNWKYDYFWLVNERDLGDHMVETLDTQYWIYDKEKETLYEDVLFSGIQVGGNCWVFGDSVLVAYDGNQKAFLKLKLQ